MTDAGCRMARSGMFIGLSALVLATFAMTASAASNAIVAVNEGQLRGDVMAFSEAVGRARAGMRPAVSSAARLKALQDYVHDGGSLSLF